MEILAYLHNTKTRPNFTSLNRCNASVTLAQEYRLRAYKCKARMSAPQTNLNALRLILRPYLGRNTTIGGGIGGLLINFPALRNHCHRVSAFKFAFVVDCILLYNKTEQGFAEVHASYISVQNSVMYVSRSSIRETMRHTPVNYIAERQTPFNPDATRILSEDRSFRYRRLDRENVADTK